jgi:hypothetical protein
VTFAFFQEKSVITFQHTLFLHLLKLHIGRMVLRNAQLEWRIEKTRLKLIKSPLIAPAKVTPGWGDFCTIRLFIILGHRMLIKSDKIYLKWFTSTCTLKRMNKKDSMSCTIATIYSLLIAYAETQRKTSSRICYSIIRIYLNSIDKWCQYVKKSGVTINPKLPA